MAGKRISELTRSKPLPTDIIPIGREEGLLTLGVTVGSIQDDFTEQKYKLLTAGENTFTVSPSTNNMTVVLSCGTKTFNITINQDSLAEYRLGHHTYFCSINESNTPVECTEGGYIQYLPFNYDSNISIQSQFELKKFVLEIQPFQTIKLQFVTPEIWLLGFAFGGMTVINVGTSTTGTAQRPGVEEAVPTPSTPEELAGTGGVFIDYITDTTIVIETTALQVDEETNPNLFMVTAANSAVEIVSINDSTIEIVTNLGRAAYAGPFNVQT